MKTPAVPPEKKKSGKKDYVSAFAGVLARFTSPHTSEEVLSEIPSLLVSEFDAARAELWLWDDSSRSVHLTRAAGKSSEHSSEFVAAGSGVLGKVAENRRAAPSVALSSFGGEDQKFAQRSGFTHVSAYPLLANGKLAGIAAIYGAAAAEEEQLKWWLLYSEVAGVALQEALASRESRKTISQLSLLFEATRLLNSTLDLGELLELILKIARDEVGADRGTVFLVDNKHQELWSIVASGLDHQEIRVPLGKGVAGRVAQTGETVNVEDAYALDYHDHSFDQKFSYKTRSMLSLPIRHRTGEIVGVLQLLNKISAPRFTAEDEDFLNKLSGHMAMALENARLHRESLERQRLEKELALARGIQRSLLPDSPPVVPGYEIAVLNEPCFEVGGDYFDFLNLGPQSLLLVVGDVEGKGVSSALVMSNLQASLRALVMHLHSLEVLTMSLNEMMFNDTKSQKFLSLFLGLIDTRRNGLHYINAGHVPPLLIHGDQGEYRELTEGGTVVGLFPQTEYVRGSVKLATGDILVCCTDGIPEASNAAEDEYGAERLAACVLRHRSKSAAAIVDAVAADVVAFSRGGTHVDDKVLMITKVTKEGLVSSGNVSPMG